MGAADRRESDDGQLDLYDEGLEISYRRGHDAQGVELATGTVPINGLGGFDISIDVPDGANLGQGWLDLSLLGLPNDENASTGHPFQIQEFRRPEFEVNARQESAGPHYVSEPTTVAVDARYFVGGPLPDADVTWLVTAQETTYRPPNWDDHQFGVWQPWWWFDGFGGDQGAVSDVAGEPCFDCGPGGAGATYEELSGRTDAGGTHYLQVELHGESNGDDIDLPRTVTAEATVFDVDRQAWASRTDLLVHPARAYVGLRSDRTFVEEGTPLRYDVVVVDVDGLPVPGLAAEVVAGRLEWSIDDGVWSQQVVEPQTCTLTSSATPDDGSMRCEFPTELGGEYRITATVTDSDGRRNRTETTTWVSGTGTGPIRNVEQERSPSCPTRRPTARRRGAILVQAPFDAAEGVMTIRTSASSRPSVFEIEDGTAVTLTDPDPTTASVPDLTVQVDVVGTRGAPATDGTAEADVPRCPVDPPTRSTPSRPAGVAGPAHRRRRGRPHDRQIEPGDDTAGHWSATVPARRQSRAERRS